MKTLFTIFFITLSVSEICIISTIATSGFLVTAPKYLLIGSKEKICISIHKGESRTPVNIMLLNLNSDEVIATTTDFVKGNTSCLLLHIPRTTNATGGRLQVRLQPSNENDLTNLSEQNVELKSDPLVTIIAVEKPIYRPGEVVRFRILSLTHKLKIDQSKLRRVWIESPNGITIEQWWNVKTDTGLAQLEISLSDECLLGSWKIKIQHFHNNFIEEKAFLVNEYVLPWFEVNVVQPKEILADTPEVTFEICAKYSYGAPVRGDVTVQLNLKTPQPNEQPKIIYDSKLDKWTGCSTVNVSGSGLLLTNQDLQPNSVEMTATVTEATTKKSEKSVIDFQIYNSAVQLQFHCSEYFKPGLPYKGTVKVLSASGQPTIAVGLLIQICMREENPNKILEYHKQCWNYSTDYSSEVVFTLPPHPNTTGLITITAVSLEHKNKYFSESNWRLLMVQPKATQELTPWFSPSRSYIDISTVSPVVCNMLHSFHVQYTVSEFSDPTPTFFYLVESRGDLLHIGNLKPENEKPMVFKVAEGFPPSRAFILPVLITPDMSPEARILVYYIRDDNEIVAASAVVFVDKCFPNNVRARWKEQTVWPGANVSLNIRAHPFSLCGLNIVDSMMTKRYSDEMLSDRIIWKKLEVYKTPFIETPINFCKYDDETITSPVNRRKRMLYLRRPSNLYKDAVTAFSDLGVVVLTDLILETRPCSNHLPSFVPHSSDYFVSRVNMVEMDVIPDSNVNLLAAISEPDNLEFNNTVELRTIKSNLVRTFFPEAWLWNITTIGELGETVLNMNVPHSVTTWNANVFCVSNEVGFGMAEPPSITSFIPFFLMVSTPKTLIRTETLPVTVTIYNYLSHSLPVKIILSTSAGLNIVNEQNELSDCLTELSPKSYEFKIVAHKTGLLNITATAVVLPDLTNCSPGIYQGINDTMVKTVKVQAEGFPISKFYSSLLCGNDHLKSFWDLSLPSNVINNTTRATVTLSAELLGPALKSLGDLVEMPTGCGEQNMIKLAPNVHVLRYLKIVTIPDGEKIKEKAIMHIQKGYQKQLTYRHDDGSYSAFGPSLNREESSIWLTAFVLSTFGQAKNLITIDNNSLKETLDWILSKQMENGCFQSVGYVFTYGLRGGLSGTDSPAALTAYIIASLYKSGLYFPPTVTTNAEFCLSAENSNSNTNVYSLSLITYAFAILNTTLPKTQDSLQKLKQLAKYDQDLTWWENPDDSMALKIETTGYAILSLLKVGGPENLVMAQKAVRWISTNRNNKGGFVSTQDTVVGLEALITFATTVPMDSRMSLLVNIIEVANDQTYVQTLSIDDSNAALQQEVSLVHLPSLVHAKTRGRGCALVQATFKYNVDKNSSGSGFELEVTTAPLSDFDECHFQKVEVCARYTLLEVSSSMAVIIINLPTGYVPDRDSLYAMTGIQRFDEDIEGNKLDVYLHEVRFIPTCFHFTIQRVHYVTNPAPAIVTIIDYYHPEHTQSVNYSVNCEETTPFTDTPDIGVPSNIDNFNNVDHELDVPEGVEGPQPLYAPPPTSSSAQPLV